MFSNLKLLCLILTLMTTLSGCGDLLGSKVVKRNFGSNIAALTCDLDMNRFADIMNQNISSHIRCLGESLNVFIKIVKSGKPGYLSRIQLERYLADFRPDVKPEVVKALGSVFNLGHLITGEDPNYISKNTIDKVINFALIFNEEAALNFGPTFQNTDPASYTLHQNHRERVSGASKTIIQALRLIFNPNRNGEIHKINIIELLESFSSESNRNPIEKAKKVLFIKKILFGGDSEIVTHTELEKLILNFDHLLLISLDITRYKYIILKQNSILQLLKRDVNDLYDIINQGSLNNRDNEVLFTVNEATEAAKLFIDKDELDLDKYTSLIAEIKKITMDGNSTEVKGIEFKKLFTHIKLLLQKGTVFHRIYEKFKVQLESSQPVTIDFSEYRHTYPEHQIELDQFERIVHPKTYRFMKGEFLSPYYTKGYRRNADAIFEIALLEYAIKLVFSNYGSRNANSIGGYSIDQDQMRKLLLKFESELIDLDLLTPQRTINSADNISLLGTLFQYQSDKNKVMDVNEASEFGVSLLSSLNISNDIYSFMKEQNCSTDEVGLNGEMKNFNRIEPVCFRTNFWKALCANYRNYYPLLFDSINAPKKCEDLVPNEKSALYLAKAIEAARSCNNYTNGKKEEVFYSKGDIMTIILTMVHVETTIIRWDLNGNNIMDADEVNRAYDIYEPALDGFLEGKSSIIKKFKKQIYQYMIKYEEVPDEKDFGSILKFVKFLLKFNKSSSADRKTIASVLVSISKQNKVSETVPVFNCNLLRNPDEIPRESDTVYPAVDTREDFSSILIPYLYLAK